MKAGGSIQVALLVAVSLPNGLAAFAQSEQPATGENSIQISVPSEGQYVVRLLPSPDAKTKNHLPVVFRDKTTTVRFTRAELGKSPRIAVDDVSNGNTAVRPLPESGSIELKRTDFDHVREVRTRVTYEGKPVKSAVVTLTPAEGPPMSVSVDPNSEGLARFETVPAGKAKLQLVYGDGFKETRDVLVSTDHEGVAVDLPAAVTNAVPTLESAAELDKASDSGTLGSARDGGGPAVPSREPGVERAREDQGGGLTGFLGTLLGLAAAGGLAYLLYRWAKSGGMTETLKKAGIEVSGPQPAPDTGTPWNPNAAQSPVVSDPSLCSFCGQKKDAAGNCACTLSGAALAAGHASPVTPAQPRLVATAGVYSGSVFPLSDHGSGVLIGRDPANTVSLSNDTTVSRRHASVRSEGGSFSVTDEGSSNGVYVNGVKIAGTQPLRPGDEVQIGNTRFRFEL